MFIRSIYLWWHKVVLDKGGVFKDDNFEEVVNFQVCLLWKFFTDRKICINVMNERLASVWRLGHGVVIMEVETGLFLFQFYHICDHSQGAKQWCFRSNTILHHSISWSRCISCLHAPWLKKLGSIWIMSLVHFCNMVRIITLVFVTWGFRFDWICRNY